MSEKKLAYKYEGCNRQIDMGQTAWWWYQDGAMLDITRIPSGVQCTTGARLCIPCAQKYGIVW